MTNKIGRIEHVDRLLDSVCTAAVGIRTLKVVGHARQFARKGVAQATAGYVSSSWKWHRLRAEPHKLSSELIVTLTSYPPRYPTLALTVRSLLAQSIRPDRFYLWIADRDVQSLPENVRSLQDYGLDIRSCEDLRSYKKIIPALATDGGAFLAIADDDQYYPRNWLRRLVEAYRPGRREVICGRAHRIRLNAQRLPQPYLRWQFDVPAGAGERLLFPTGIGGVLYEPGIFHADVTRADIFRELCPSADDVWLYWMAALNGARFRKVGPRWQQVNWGDSQRVALYSINREANDAQIANMISRYGFPGSPVLKSFEGTRYEER